MDARRDDEEQATVEAPRGSSLGQVPAKARGPRFDAAAILVATLLVLAILKPWEIGAGAPGPTVPARTSAPASIAPTATSDITPEGIAAPVCLGTQAWRIATVETWQLVIAGAIETQQVRVWRAIDPVATALGPDDSRIPIVPIASMEIDALGWCAPSSGPGRALGRVDVTVWRLGHAGAAAEVTVRRVAPTVGETPFAALYREVTDCLGGYGCSGSGVPLLAPTWAPGRYVLRYLEQATARTWWFGAELQIVPQPGGPATQPTPKP
jgi:hypothetical protein